MVVLLALTIVGAVEAQATMVEAVEVGVTPHTALVAVVAVLVTLMLSPLSLLAIVLAMDISRSVGKKCSKHQSVKDRVDKGAWGPDKCILYLFFYLSPKYIEPL